MSDLHNIPNTEEDDGERTDSFSTAAFLHTPALRSPPEVYHPILICLSGESRGARYRLRGMETVIGRSRDCGIPVHDGGASRRHAKVIYENHDRSGETPICYVEDMDSRNGTELNGVKVRKKMRLKERDRIMIGRTIFGFFLRDTEELSQDESLYENATRDALTGLENRAQMLSHLKYYMALASRKHIELCLLLIDVDRFKMINDTHGHPVGDEALRHLSKILQRCCRESDLVARWGGEEFAVSLPDCTIENGVLFAERIRLNVQSTPLILGDLKVPMTVSGGLAYLHSSDTAQSLFDRADKALYEAKTGGRNKIVCSEGDPISNEARDLAGTQVIRDIEE